MSGQWTLGMETRGLAYPSIHRPTGAALLDDGPGLVQPEVSEFGLSWDRAVVDTTADDKSTSDPAAHVDPEDRIAVGAGSMAGFTEGSNIRVVVDRDGKTGQSMKPLAEFELMPAFDLVGACDPSGSMVDGTAKANPDPDGFVGLDQGREVVGQFGTNAISTRGPIHLETGPFEKTSVSCSGDQLEFGAPDLDSERGHARAEVGLTPRAESTGFWPL